MADSDKLWTGAQRVLLFALFPLIWLLDLSWWALSPDVVLVAALIPLAWIWAERNPDPVDAAGPSAMGTLVAVALCALGIFMQSMTMMAFTWSWLAVVYLLPPTSISRSRLWVLCAGAFPWVLIDAELVGWWFRLSGADLTGWLFYIAGMEVVARGTQLEIEGLPISIEAACGGLQMLQVLMSAGVALTLIRFPRERGFWFMLGLLPVLAWISNTFRIIVISAWGVAFGADAAAGLFHT
jgi:exosortase/archaeosortase family protein